ncbi:hypothetical protein MtrunA17_Chr8g0383681 [Medicago truncatula]|uniref:Uncharacterized protein n=1 Tax=Medicago truncatula TaxID=3880 RepID=A0A396GPK5_MEDTR|nr:hypothetical protein MtrunA17_Chr8g0383681 [Medicago truncatula]
MAIPAGKFVKVESAENMRSEETFTGFKDEGFEGFGISIEALGISIWVFESMCPTVFSSSLFRRVLMLIDSPLEQRECSVVVELV